MSHPTGLLVELQGQVCRRSFLVVVYMLKNLRSPIYAVLNPVVGTLLYCSFDYEVLKINVEMQAAMVGRYVVNVIFV